MNILFVCSAKKWGGNEKWTSMAAHGLSKNHSVYYALKNRNLHSKFGDNIPALFLPFFHWTDLWTYLKLYRYVKEKNIDLIISTKKKEYALCGILSRRLGIKHIIRLGIVRNMNFPLWHNWVYNKLNDGIIVNAYRIKDNLQRYAFMQQKPIRVIYNGIPQKQIYQPENKSKDKFTISSVGMLTKRKGFHLLIAAVAMLRDDLKRNIRINIAGEGRYKSELEMLAKKLGLSEQVYFYGFIKNPGEILAGSDLFALATSNEGISNAILEAMQYSLPVITTTAGGAAEFIRHRENGFLLKNRDANELSALLTEILTGKFDLPKIGLEGKETVERLFSPERMEREIEEFCSGPK